MSEEGATNLDNKFEEEKQTAFSEAANKYDNAPYVGTQSTEKQIFTKGIFSLKSKNVIAKERFN